MKYYKVKSEFDNKRLLTKKSKTKFYELLLIKNELYTPKEYEKLKQLFDIRLKDEYFDLIEVSKKTIYLMFGARFSTQYDYN